MNKRTLITCLLLLLIASVATFAWVKVTWDMVKTAGSWANEAASAYYNISATVDKLKVTLEKLEAKRDTAKAIFYNQYSAYKGAKARYDAEVAEFWSANTAYKDADRKENLADIKIAHAEARIAHCRVMLDATRNSQSAAHWNAQLSQAQQKLREGKSERTRARQDKARANVRFKRARANMPILKNERDRWKKWSDGAYRIYKPTEKRVKDKAEELELEEKALKIAKAKHDAAVAEYEELQAEYDEQNKRTK